MTECHRANPEKKGAKCTYHRKKDREPKEGNILEVSK